MAAPPPFLIAFLDFDGVLNSVSWIKRRPSKVAWAVAMNISPEEFSSNRYEWALRSIDPEAVAALNTFITRTQARVVISSSWRTMFQLNRLEWFLRWHGFEHHLLGATPDGFEMRAASGYTEFVSRGLEIQTWLGLLPPHLEVRWVVLDDELVEGHEDRLYQTDVEVGLTTACIPKIIDILYAEVKRPP